MQHGATLLELVLETGMGTLGDDGVVRLPGRVVVTIDGDAIDRCYWHVCRPAPGRLVNIFLIPKGQREAILIGASLLIAVAAFYTGGAAATAYGPLVGGLAGATVAVGGTYALHSFVPLTEDNGGISGPQASSAVTGDSNRLDRNAFVPIVLAREIKIIPYHYGKPYTEAAGSDVYWRMLLAIGQGPLQITDVKAGGTLLDSLPEAYEYEVLEGRLADDPPTLFTTAADVAEVNPALTFGELFASTPQIQTMAVGSTEGSVDITFPGGIFHQGKVNRDAYTVVYTIERRESGSADPWVDFVTGGASTFHTERHETSNLIRKSHRSTTLNPAITYDVRVSRTNGDGGTSNPSAMFWTALRSIQPNDPRPDKTIACIAIRAKKTGSGTVPVISCTVGSYALDWNGATWVEAVTGNPASLGRHLLQGAGVNPNPVADARMDLPSWQDFHDHCETESFEFNGVFDDEGISLERLQVVLAAGRGRLIPPETTYAVAIDRNGKSVSGMITPRNSSSFEGVHILRDEVQALRCLFIDETSDYQVTERLVFADGYDEGSVDDGKIEIFDMTSAGITDPDLVWRHARYRLADMALRLDLYSVIQDIENLQHVPGDLVRFQHHVPLLGLKAPRITSVTLNGSSEVTEITVDDLITMEGAKSYAARVRLIGDDDADHFVVRPVATVAGDTYTLTFTTPFDAAVSPQVGDLLTFGEAGIEDIPCLVQDITPGRDNTARIVLVDEAPAVNDADQGEIPAYQSFITLPGDFFGIAPAVPVIAEIVIANISHPAQPDVITQQELIVHLSPLGSELQPPTGYEVEIKRADQLQYQRRIPFPADATELTIPIVQSDVLYDVRARATGRSPRGIPNESDWSTVFSIYVPLPAVTTAATARVTHLELQGQGDNTMFQGPDAHFTWSITAISGAFQLHGGQGQLIGFIDPQFAWYEVKVIDPVTAYVRRIVNTTTPDFIYPISDNKEDSRKQAAVLGGSSRPLRRFTVQVTFVDRFGRRGPGRSLTVENPAPAAPSGLIVSGQVSALFVKAQTPTDDDFEKLIVYIGATTGFDPAAPTTQVQEALTNFLTIPAAAGTTLYVRVALADRFSDDIADLNLSSEIGVPIESPDGPPRFTVEGIEFLPILATNTVQWTSGAVFVQDGATVTEEAVAAGTAVWTSGTLWLYYVRASGVIQATTNAALAQQPDRIALAQYRGGNRLTRTTGDFIPANIVSVGAGPTASPGKNSSSLLLVLDPITTSGNPVVIRASAAANMTANSVGAVQSGFLQIRRDGAVLQQVKIMEAARPETLSHNSDFWAGGFDIEDNQAAGTYIYELWAANSINNSSFDSNTSYQGLSLTAQEVAY